MKTVQLLLSIIIVTIIFIFGCQSDGSIIPDKASPFYLDIQLPSSSIDTLLEHRSMKSPEIDIYLKTDVDSVGKSNHTLSINDKIASFDELNKLSRYHQFNPQRNQFVSNLYIDKNTPFYLVDYLHKRLIDFGHYRISYSNKKGQHFLHKIPPSQQNIWRTDQDQPSIVAPPPPPPPRRNLESDSLIFSEKYLATLKRFGIDQKPIPNTGSDLIACFPSHSTNFIEIKLNADNQVSIKETIINLDAAIQRWQSFMTDETQWRKKIVFLVISGEADYEHYFKLYSTVLSAFQQKRNQLSVEMFGQKLSALSKDQKRLIYGILPRVIIPELGD